MADIDDGGPAYPVLLPDGPPGALGMGQPYKQHPGMTLLDHYAGVAMELAMQKMRDNYTANLGEDWNWDASDFEGIAIIAFDMAEAMMVERKKRYG